jgi:hypothetical protein
MSNLVQAIFQLVRQRWWLATLLQRTQLTGYWRLNA